VRWIDAIRLACCLDLASRVVAAGADLRKARLALRAGVGRGLPQICERLLRARDSASTPVASAE
jgi:hypothetical protein